MVEPIKFCFAFFVHIYGIANQKANLDTFSWRTNFPPTQGLIIQMWAVFPTDNSISCPVKQNFLGKCVQGQGYTFSRRTDFPPNEPPTPEPWERNSYLATYVVFQYNYLCCVVVHVVLYLLCMLHCTQL